MASVIVVESKAPVRGYCWYHYPSIWSETTHPYAQDKWQYIIGKLIFSCTAYKEILAVGGYMPYTRWNKSSVIIPQATEGLSFEIANPFESDDRTGSEEPEREIVTCDIDKRVLHVSYCEKSCITRTWVSPHHGLILGAANVDDDSTLLLSDILFTDVLELPNRLLEE